MSTSWRSAGRRWCLMAWPFRAMAAEVVALCPVSTSPPRRRPRGVLRPAVEADVARTAAQSFLEAAELAVAQLKVRAALLPSLREHADRLRERFHLDAPGWYARASDAPHLPLVADAVWNRRVIGVRYRRWTAPAEVTRRLEPYGLVLKAGRWYLAARRDGMLRTYRVDQIIDALPNDVGFDAELGFDLAAYWQAYLADFHDRLYTGYAP
jgi:predicted DNA-binding transcriptional regulator YafY